ncbi:BolA-like protein 1 [Porphyridium purpureum]|uniref:BolA-like protein 1 n=1 Tax=Porphyridium purpureum TaxID=35688 RepID=A0A5J4YWF6_PORPP|nr:BolA-like protein 1 [Porphyridium purpureum]|eukprot:POR8668..scf227_4
MLEMAARISALPAPGTGRKGQNGTRNPNSLSLAVDGKSCRGDAATGRRGDGAQTMNVRVLARTMMSGAVGKEPGPVARQILDKLAAGLAPVSRMSLEDESHKHRGHVGAPAGSSETHFRLLVVSPRFQGMKLIARHRTVYSLLADEMASRVHALQIHALTPEEDAMGTARQQDSAE